MNAIKIVALNQHNPFVFVLHVKDQLREDGYDVSSFDKIFKDNPEG